MSRANSTMKDLVICLIVFALGTTACFGQLAFTDITLQAGTGGPTGKDELGGHGVMFAEVDNDSLPDYYLTNNFEFISDQPDLYFDNTNGAVFLETAAALGIDDEDGGSHGAVWADLDNDGDYDLLNGSTLSYGSNGNQNDVFRNNGSGMFTEVTPSVIDNRQEETRGICVLDMDKDGDVDFVLGNLGLNYKYKASEEKPFIFIPKALIKRLSRETP